MRYSFAAKVDFFDREMGWHYVAVPTDLSEPLLHLADRGLIAVTAYVGRSSWPTSLLPMGDGTHFIALPAKVRAREEISLGAQIEVSFETRARKKKNDHLPSSGVKGRNPSLICHSCLFFSSMPQRSRKSQYFLAFFRLET